MCGIVGIYNFNTNQPINPDKLKFATELIKHRGPDGEGYYFDDSNGVGLGHRRLSIIDLDTGDQPMTNEDKSLWIVYNGEIYNYKDIRTELINLGHNFKTKSDTEVILHAYEEFGFDCVRKFNGIFAFAIWDSRRHIFYLARDHFGVKPIYYYLEDGVFAFSSEIKAIKSLIGKKFSIDENALYQCLILRYVIGESTLIKQIKKLQPSHYLIINSKGDILVKRYWDTIIQVDYEKPLSYWIDKLRYLYDQAIKRQMVADVPVGLSLSGGVDSATILSIMTKYSGKGVFSFTVGFEGGKYEDNEIQKAREISRIYGANFFSYEITEKDYIEFLDKYLWHLEEPVGNESAIAYYFVAKLANGKVKVLLNGQGADEPFGGYDRYIGTYHSQKFKSIINSLSLFNELGIINLRKQQILKLKDFISERDESSKILIASSLLSEKDKSIIFKNNSHINLYKNLSEIINVCLNKYLSENITEKLFYFDLLSSLPENLLLSEDKMAMAASIEARVPFLDIELIETALQVPAKYKINFFSGKKIHKKVCENFVPRNIVYQRKIGFNNPVESWLRNKLGEELIDLINSQDSITKQYLNKSGVEELIRNHNERKNNYEKFLFLLLSVEKWKKIFLD